MRSLVAMLLNSSKLKLSLVSLLPMMKLLCIVSMISSSFRVSPNFLEILLKLLKSITRCPRVRTLLSCLPWIWHRSHDSKEFIKIDGRFMSESCDHLEHDFSSPLSPSSSSTFSIFMGLMVPPPSASKIEGCSDSHSR